MKHTKITSNNYDELNCVISIFEKEKSKRQSSKIDRPIYHSSVLNCDIIRICKNSD